MTTSKLRHSDEKQQRLEARLDQAFAFTGGVVLMLFLDVLFTWAAG